MIIEEVRLKNFRSHSNTRLNLDRGITVIIGENGAGKTSLLEAIGFALFKEKPSGVSVDELLSLGERDGEVSLTFHSNGQKYRVRRKRTHKKGAESYFYRLGPEFETLLVKGEREVTVEVENTLGINGELFTSAVYIKQGEIDKMLSSDPATRKRHMGKLIGTEDMENTHKNFLDIIREYTSKIEGLSRVPGELDEKKETLKKLKEEVREVKKDQRDLKKNISSKKTQIKVFSREIDELRSLIDKEKEINRLLEKTADLDERISIINGYETQLRDSEEKSLKHSKLKKEIEKYSKGISSFDIISDRRRRVESELSREKKVYESLEKELDQTFKSVSNITSESVFHVSKLRILLEKTVNEVKEDLSDSRKKREKVIVKKEKKKTLLDGLNKANSELKAATGNCPVCGKKLTAHHKTQLKKKYNSESNLIIKVLGELDSHEKALNKKIGESEKRLASLSVFNSGSILEKEKRRGIIFSRIKELEREKKEYEESLKELPDLQKELKKLQDETSKLQPFRDLHIEALGYLRKNLSKKEGILKDAKLALESIQLKKNEFFEDLIKIGIKADSLAGILKEKEIAHVQLDGELRSFEKQEASGISTLKWRSKRLSELKDEIFLKKQEELELRDLENFKSFLEKVRSVFHKDALQKELRLKARPLIEDYTRDIFLQFNLPYSDVSLTEDFSLKVHSEKGEESLDMLSGGERIAAALALRVGLSKALSGPLMELIILDEPTIHLDAQRRRELVEVIRRLATIPQTIVVTHDKEFEESADRIIEVVKEDGLSVIR